MGLDSGDFDGDGVRDIVVAVSGLPWATVPVSGTARILRGLGGGAFSTPTTVGTTSDAQDVTVADIDGDGVAEVTVADPAQFWAGDPGGLYVLHNDGAGHFTQSAILQAGLGPFDVQVADMTGDGVPDLVASTNGGYLSIMAGHGDGTFAPEMNFGLFGTPLAVINGDFDGNGLGDFLVVTSSGSFVLSNQSFKAPPLQIEAQISFSSPTARGSGVVTWTTNAESDLLGFNVVQLTNRGRVQINNAIIP
jgi:hypothetical protein